MKTNILSFAVLIVLLQVSCIRASRRSEKEQSILQRILDPAVYNPSIRPHSNVSGPVTIRVNTYIRSIDKLDDLNMEYSTQLTYRQRWKDERLAYMNLSEGNSEIKYISLTDPETIWTPDTFFSNEKDGHPHNMLKPNVLMRIKPDGNVLYSTRISLKLSCSMDLKYFPVDRQTCSIVAASYGYTTENLVYLWEETDPVQVTKNLHQPHFVLERYFTDYCTSRTVTGEYSCIKVDLLFQRQFYRYFMEIYLPTIILVVLSWICFWLDQRATTARILVWMTVFLAFCMKLDSLSSKVPATNYNTACDIWTTTCLLFIVVVINEIASVAFFLSGQERKLAAEDESGNDDCLKKRDSEDLPKQQSNAIFRIYRILMRKHPLPIQKIDIACRILFPLAFALFNLFYWTCTTRH